MSERRLAVFPRLIVLSGALMSVFGVAVLIANGRWEVATAVMLPTAALAVLVWFISPRQARNPLTWVLAVAVLFLGVFPFGLGINELIWPGLEMPAFEEPIPPDLPPGFIAITQVTQGLGSAAMGLLLTFGLLLFPDGRLPSRRWRWVALPVGLVLSAWFALSLYSAAPGTATFFRESSLVALLYVLLTLAPLPCIVSVFVRFRNADSTMRSQIKWVSWGGLALVVLNLISFLGGPEIFGIAGLGVLAVSYAVAISRYRLYDIDVVISRTLAYGMLAVFITIVYALFVVGVGNLIVGSSDSLLLPITATAIVALAFEPVRHAVQRWANRMVYGQRATPYEVLSDLTERLSGGEEGEGLLSRMAERLGDGTGAQRATIWLDDQGAMTVGSSWPKDPEPPRQPDIDAEYVFPVTHDGVLVGAFEVVKPQGSALSRTERALITDLAGSAGALLGYQRLNDSLEMKAEELAESRGRLVGAQDKERRRLERDLHDGAQQLIVALKVKIGLAKAMANKHDATELEGLLDGLAEEAQEALDEVRALAKGIYPPVLESDGLGSAISALTSGSSEEILVRSDRVGRYRRDVEAAVYFEISEAVTNAVKHGSGPIEIALGEADGELRFAVSDSGPGFEVARANGGAGLQNLIDRIDAVGGTVEIVSSLGQPTIVRGSVPVETQSV